MENKPYIQKIVVQATKNMSKKEKKEVLTDLMEACKILVQQI